MSMRSSSYLFFCLVMVTGDIFTSVNMSLYTYVPNWAREKPKLS